MALTPEQVLPLFFPVVLAIGLGTLSAPTNWGRSPLYWPMVSIERYLADRKRWNKWVRRFWLLYFPVTIPLQWLAYGATHVVFGWMNFFYLLFKNLFGWAGGIVSGFWDEWK
jgi:hypothetical protein